MSTKKKEVYYGWFIVAVCALLMGTMTSFLVSLEGLYLVPMSEEMGISRSAVSLAATCSGGIGLLLSPVVGKMMSKKSIRNIMTVSVAGAMLSYYLRSYVKTSLQLYLVSIAMGAFYAFAATVPIAVLTSRWFVKKQGLAFSIAAIGSSFGTMIWSPVLTGLIDDYGWRIANRYLALAIFAVLTPLVFFVVRNDPADKGLDPYGAGEETDDKKTETITAGPSLGQARKSLAFWFLLLGIFIMMITVGGTKHVPAFLTDSGFSPENVALYTSLYAFAGILSKLLMGIVCDRFGIKGGLVMGLGLTVAAYIVAFYVNSFAMLIVIAVINGLASGRTTILPPIFTKQYFGTEHYSEIYGWVNAIVSLGMAVNGTVIALIYDNTGNYNAAWYFIIATSVLSAVILLAGENNAKKTVY